jgi:hypothetical protein
MKNLYLFVYIILSIIFYCSCSKLSLNKETTTTSDNSISEFLFNDIYAFVDDEVKATDDSITVNTSSCPIITVNYIDSITKQRNLIFDFGDGCVGADGKSRSGKIIVAVDGAFSITGTSIIVSLDNYHVNSYKVEGQKTITNTSNVSGVNNPSYSVSVTEGKISTPDGKSLSWNSFRNNEWVEGSNTPTYIWDDVYHITGSSDGINSDGRSYTITITDQLKKQMSCRWVNSGTMQIQPESLNTRILDFGEGTCDNDAVVTIKKRTHNIKLF